MLGIGTSSPVIVENWNGIELARPYQRARDTLLFLRAALAGDKVSAEYESFAISGFRLDPPPPQPPALALAALRPGMVRLAASLADGEITNWLAPSDVPAVRAVAGPECELFGEHGTLAFDLLDVSAPLKLSAGDGQTEQEVAHERVGGPDHILGVRHLGPTFIRLRALERERRAAPLGRVD